MPSYAPSYTPRYRLRYRNAGVEHTVTVRGARGTGFSVLESNMLAAWGNIDAAITSLVCTDFEAISADIALTDSDVFEPATAPTFTAGSLPPGDVSPVNKIKSWTWSGRAAGSKARFSLFGLLAPDDNSAADAGDAIITAAEETAVGTVAGIASGAFFSGSGNPASFYPRATIKVNDALLRRVRKGTIA